jgi:hypothetical protein
MHKTARPATGRHHTWIAALLFSAKGLVEHPRRDGPTSLPGSLLPTFGAAGYSASAAARHSPSIR